MTKVRKPHGYWTKERCHEEALKYSHRGDFKNTNRSAYSIALRNNWIDDICGHMAVMPRKRMWTLGSCREEAMKYQTKSEFRKNSSGCYTIASRNNWIDDICKHMGKPRKPHGYWTKERCHEEALKYQSRFDFQKNSPAYKAALNNGWIDDVCKHMVLPTNKNWSKEDVLVKAQSCNSFSDFRKLENSAYLAALNNDWMRDVNQILPRFKCENGYWTKERCREEALKYTSVKEFRTKASSAYSAASKNGWFNQISKHLKRDRNPTGYWTKERCHRIALDYESRGEFATGDVAAYCAARKKKWLDDICSHMIPQGDFDNRYVYELADHADKIIYIGLTCNLDKRERDHMLRNRKLDRLFEKGIRLNPISKLLPADEAARLERQLIKKYNSLGYTVLNEKAGGSIGQVRKRVTRKTCESAAKICKNWSEFQVRFKKEYDAVRRNGWEDLTLHFVKYKTRTCLFAPIRHSRR